MTEGEVSVVKNGIIVKVYDDYSVVLAEKQYYRIKNKDGMDQGQPILFTEIDLYEKVTQRRGYKRYIALAASMILMISTGLFMNSDDVSSYVVIDINPSIQLMLDSDEIVVDYEALNEDADNLDLQALEGMGVDEAVEFITLSASQAGYLDLEDLEDDYILITTVSDDDEKDVEELIAQLKESSDIMKGVNVAINTASEEEMNQAKDEKVVLGLYVASENRDKDDITSVKAYFSDESLAEAFEEYGTILEEDYGHIIDRINNNLENLVMDEDLKQEIKDVFIASKEEFFEAKEAVTEAKEAYKAALASGDEAAIADAKLKLDEAEAYKESLEAYKDSVEEVKDLLLDQLDDKTGDLEDLLEQIEADKEEREAEREADKEEREADKEEREAEREADKEEREAERDADEEEREVDKEEREAEREADKEERDADKEEREAEREADKEEREAEKQQRGQEKEDNDDEEESSDDE